MKIDIKKKKNTGWLHLFKNHSYQKMISNYQDRSVKDGYLLCFLVIPLVLVYLIESFASHSLMGGFQFLIFHPYSYLVNALIIITSLSLALLFYKRIGVILLISIIWLFAGIVNGILLFFRVTPLGGSDLKLFEDGLNVLSKYLNIPSLIGIITLVCILIIMSVLLFIKTPSAEKKPAYIISVPIIIGTFFLTWGSIFFGQTSGLLENQFRELSQSYRKNGFIYCFGASLVDVGISKPNDYSTEAMEQIAENIQAAEDSSSSYYSHKPNVIIVQLESFFNVNRLKNVQFSKNPIPNFTEMMNNCPSGAFSVPVIGAGTVNSEFEVLTGMNIDDFGIGEYPYKTILKETACESLAYDLKLHDYTAYAIHDHEGAFYDRNLVYPNLGFDIFTSIEYMWPEDNAYTALDWTKDSVLLDEIETALDSTPGQDFVFTVSVQGHGSYPSDPQTDFIHHVITTSSTIDDEDYLNQINYYVNQLYETDQFIGNLCQMLKKRKETSILVMYGDHCPSLDLSDDDLSSGSVYDTEYFIWNNAGLRFHNDDIEAYEIGSIVLNALEVSDGAINAYHQNSRKKLDSLEITAEDYLSGLKDLEYDILYGDKIALGGTNPYAPSDMQMGFKPITIYNARQTKDHVLIIDGDGFTRYSSIRINGDRTDTLYLDPHTLVASDITLQPGDKITVSQSSLSETQPYIYLQMASSSD